MFIRCVYPNDRCLSGVFILIAMFRRPDCSGRMAFLHCVQLFSTVYSFSPLCTAVVHHPLGRKSIMITPLLHLNDYYLTLFAPDQSLWQGDRKVHLFDLNHFSVTDWPTSTTTESSTNTHKGPFDFHNHKKT